MLLKFYSGRSWFLRLSWTRGGFSCKNIMSPLLFPQLVLYLLHSKHSVHTISECSETIWRVGRHNSPPSYILVQLILTGRIKKFETTRGKPAEKRCELNTCSCNRRQMLITELSVTSVYCLFTKALPYVGKLQVWLGYLHYSSLDTNKTKK